MSYSIGYYANTKRYTQVHINESGKPVCGSQIGNDLRYQWCAHGYTQWDYLECEHCKNWYRRKLVNDIKHVKNRRV